MPQWKTIHSGMIQGSNALIKISRQNFNRIIISHLELTKVGQKFFSFSITKYQLPKKFLIRPQWNARKYFLSDMLSLFKKKIEMLLNQRCWYTKRLIWISCRQEQEEIWLKHTLIVLNFLIKEKVVRKIIISIVSEKFQLCASLKLVDKTKTNKKKRWFFFQIYFSCKIQFNWSHIFFLKKWFLFVLCFSRRIHIFRL